MGLTERIARACAAHPWRTFAAWALVLVAAITAIATLMSGLTTDATVTGNPESEQAERLLVRGFPPDPQRTVTDVIVVRSDEFTVDDPEFRRVVDQLERDARNSGALVSGRTYYGTNDASLVSKDRHATLMPVFVVGEDRVDDLLAILDSAEESGAFTATITGNHAADNDFNALSEKDLREGELKFGLPAALVILVLVFGALVAALIPLLMAIVSIVVALGLVALLSQQFELSIFIVNMLTGMGLALGIDYSLFVISRYREERTGGRDPDAAISAAGATASRAVLFSGSAFVVALLGMLIVPTTIMRSLALGAILVGIVSVAAALTLLPALLGGLHDRVDSIRLPVVGRRSIESANPEGRFWGAIIDRVLRRPWLSLAIATGLLLAATVPAFGLNIGASGVSTLPDDLPSKQGYVALQRDFPTAGTDPAQIVVADTSPDTMRRLESLRSDLAAYPEFGPGEIRRGNGVAVLEVPVRGDEVSDEAVGAVRALRDDIVPGAFEGTNVEAHVGGTSSENADYFDAVTKPAPLVFAFVLGLTLILLTVAFRSVAIALTAIALNLLSVGAAYGLLVLVFQHGFGADLLGFTQVDSIDAWVPLFLFSVLFGLSMDYQVFLLSRIRERYDRTRDTRDAVRWGVASTARIITGAALIIVAVFSGFARGDLVMFQQMGFGVAIALLIDATIIRSVVLPSVMALLGDRNWYLPRWLEWTPHLEVEGHTAPESNTAPST
ncbi:MAG: MMPL family transporter [Actinobacteria bacterium]|nr:MMPL family transporter [Actinomycetota bacterium]